jgi:hypothetical protein
MSRSRTDLLDGVERDTVPADAGSDDDEVVVEPAARRAAADVLACSPLLVEALAKLILVTPRGSIYAR